MSLIPFLALVKGAKGTACTQLIQDVLNAPGIFVFAELLEAPNVKELSQNPQHKPHHDLLSLFAFGTYEDYKLNSNTLPTLTPTQLKKLKQLTIVTLASSERILFYEKLLQYLDISNVRELEDLVIDAIYQEIIRGKLDQKRGCIEIESSMGRDLKPGQAGLVLQTLQNWSQVTEGLLKAIEYRLQAVAADTVKYAKDKEELEKLIEHVKKEEKSRTGSNRGGAADMESFDPRREQFHGMFEDENRRAATRRAG
ncbi:COP9 signalosome complex subunit 7a [Phlyctochytrium planicorne]|nr:COP9 signalosome complex subunit 7a [Phlyctochytrium planicorne]